MNKKDIFNVQIEKQVLVAKKIKEEMGKMNIEDCEEKFCLIKEIMIYNEQNKARKALKDLFSDYIKSATDWIRYIITFMLGILSSLIISDTTNSNIKIYVFAFALMGVFIDVMRNSLQDTKTFTVGIIENMTYQRYLFFDKSRYCHISTTMII